MILDTIQIGKKIIFYVVLMVLLISCVDESDLKGIYVIKFDKNVDSIRIMKDNEYIRSIYDAGTGKLIFKNQSSWKYQNSEITLKNFLENEGELIYNKNIKSYDKYLMTYYSLPVSWGLRGITIDLNKDLGYYYVKQN